jgi:hypothetical protein
VETEKKNYIQDKLASFCGRRLRIPYGTDVEIEHHVRYDDHVGMARYVHTHVTEVKEGNACDCYHTLLLYMMANMNMSQHVYMSMYMSLHAHS